MSIMRLLPSIIDDGKEEYEKLAEGLYGKFNEEFDEEFIIAENVEPKNNDLMSKGLIANGDNLQFMLHLLKKNKKIDLIYIDPPFCSKADYSQQITISANDETEIPTFKQKAYNDTWEHGMEGYLRMMVCRLFLMKDLLADSGSIWIHLDWHASHYMKVILDEIFGEKNFLNEVVWNYKSGGSCKNHFARKHDTLLFYRKSQKHCFYPLKEKSYNRGFKPYRFKGVKEYQDKLGWHTLVNMRDVWQIDMVGRTSSERTGYATQKPLALLLRIIESCTKEGDICADFFGGSGTLAAAANVLKRNWITCDIGLLSTISTEKRMLKADAAFELLIQKVASNQDGQGKLTVNSNLIKEGNINKVKIALISYEFPPHVKIPVEDKHLPMIHNLLKANSLQFMDYWSIDLSYNEKVFNPQKFFIKDKNVIEDKLEIEVTEKFNEKIAIRAVDIFGNSCLNVLNLERELDEKN